MPKALQPTRPGRMNRKTWAWLLYLIWTAGRR
jgi:hypothetical protein